MLISRSTELNSININNIGVKIGMKPFDLDTLEGVPLDWKETVSQMILGLNLKVGTAFLTIHGKQIKASETHRRGGAHIDGNFLMKGWGGNQGGNGWKVDGNGIGLTQSEHNRSYCSRNGGMLIASTYPACMGWNGNYKGESGIGGDCSNIELGEGFIMKPNTVYYGNSQFIHESLPLDKDVHRTLIRITLPENHPIQ